MQKLLDHPGPEASPGERRRLQESLILKAPLTTEAIERAEAVHRLMRGRSASVPERSDPEQPLDFRFANYTVGRNGVVIPGSTGWTRAERRRFSRFIRRMSPIVRELYGDPFERWTITMVKDLQYEGSWIFFPSVLEIHAGEEWNPKLLAHELFHAFRGRRGLTSDANWNHSPTLSGFEEGFAEGMANVAMNAYVARYCSDGDCSAADVPSQTLWDSYLEWVYDFSNDASLTCEDFWGPRGTVKVSERYAMAGAAVMRLETAVTSFSRRFNEEYYARIRDDDSYRPSREAVIAIIESLSPVLEGMPAREWVDRQHIFDSRTIYGKRDWTVNYTPRNFITDSRMRALYFMETFPNGSDWRHPIPDCPIVPGGGGHLLYYRLHGTEGRVRLDPEGPRRPGRSYSVEMQYDPAQDSRSRGCNDVPGAWGKAELRWIREPEDCVSYLGTDPICIEQSRELGVHRLSTSWQNPHYGLSADPPTYAMPYDAEQATISSTQWVLAGRLPPDYSPYRHRFIGGIVGGGRGTVTITHSERPGVVTARVSNGVFYAEVPTCETWSPGDSCWAKPYAPWSSDFVSVPGTLTLRFDGDDGTHIEEQRIIVFGFRGYHEFLLGRPTSGPPELPGS